MVRVRKVLSLPQMAVALTIGMASGIYIYRSPLQQYKVNTAPPDSKGGQSQEASKLSKLTEKPASTDSCSDILCVSEKQR